MCAQEHTRTFSRWLCLCKRISLSPSFVRSLSPSLSLLFSLSRSHSLSLAHSLACSLALSLPLFLSLTLFLSLYFARSRFLLLSLARFLPRSRYFSRPLSLARALSLSTPALSLVLPPSFSLIFFSLAVALSLLLSYLSRSLSHTHTYTQTHTHRETDKKQLVCVWKCARDCTFRERFWAIFLWPQTQINPNQIDLRCEKDVKFENNVIRFDVLTMDILVYVFLCILKLINMHLQTQTSWKSASMALSAWMQYLHCHNSLQIFLVFRHSTQAVYKVQDKLSESILKGVHDDFFWKKSKQSTRRHSTEACCGKLLLRRHVV